MDPEQFRPRIEEILRSSDLQTLTAKQVRRQLEREYQFDSSSAQDPGTGQTLKKRIDRITVELFERLLAEKRHESRKTEPADANIPPLDEDHVPPSEAATKADRKPPVEASSSSNAASADISSSQKSATSSTVPLADRTIAPPIPAPSPPPMKHRTSIKPTGRKNISSEVVFDSDDSDPGVEDGAPYERPLDDEAFARQLQAAENARPRRAAKATAAVKKPKKRRTVAAEGESGAKKRKTGFHQTLLLSPALSDLLGGVEEMSRPDIVKAVWAYIRQHNLQDESDRRFVMCDEKLQKVMDNKTRVSMFGMNKYLTNNVYKKDEVVGGTPDESNSGSEDEMDYDGLSPSAGSSSKPKKVAKKSATVKSEGKKRGGGGGGGFMRPMTLSPALSDLLNGAQQMPRPTVVKEIWNYVKSRNMQDPADKRFILCDEKLKKVMDGLDRVSGFKMNKYLGAHLSAPGELVNDSIPESDSESGDMIPDPLEPSHEESKPEQKSEQQSSDTTNESITADNQGGDTDDESDSDSGPDDDHEEDASDLSRSDILE